MSKTLVKFHCKVLQSESFNAVQYNNNRLDAYRITLNNFVICVHREAIPPYLHTLLRLGRGSQNCAENS